MFSWLHQYSPNAILLKVGPVTVYWYGLLIVFAIILATWLAIKLGKKNNLKPDQIFDLVFYLVIFGIIGARLWHVLFYNPAYFFAKPWEILKIWHGGLAIQGSIFSGLAVIYFYCRKRRLLFGSLADLTAVVLPLAQAIGRWGNYFNQELFGKPCLNSWCIPINSFNRPANYATQIYFQPLFLYESVLDLLLFFVLLKIYLKKPGLPGLLVISYLIGYSLIRFGLEFLRLDSGLVIGPLKLIQWFCLIVIIASLAVLKLRVLPKKAL